MRTTTILLSAFAFAALSTQGRAADPPQNHNPAMREACASDLASLCGGVPAGQATMQCLMKNQDKASPGCKEAMAAMRARGGSPPPGMGAGMGGTMTKPQ